MHVDITTNNRTNIGDFFPSIKLIEVNISINSHSTLMMTKSTMRPLALISLATAVVTASSVNHDFYTLDDDTTESNMTLPLQTLEMRLDDDNKDIDSAIPLETLEMRLRANDGQKKTKRTKDSGMGNGNKKKKAGNIKKNKKSVRGGGRKKTRAGDVSTKKKSDVLPKTDIPNLREKDKRTSATDEGKKAKVDASAIMKDKEKRNSAGDEGKKKGNKPRSGAAAVPSDKEEAGEKGKKKETDAADGSEMAESGRGGGRKKTRAGDVSTKKKSDELPQSDIPNLREKDEQTSATDEGKKAKVDASAIMKDKVERYSAGDKGKKEDNKPRSGAAVILNDREKAGEKGKNKETDAADVGEMAGKLDRFGNTLGREKEKKASAAEPIRAKIDASSVMSNKEGQGGGKDKKKKQRGWKSPSKSTEWSHNEDTL
jgi:hypothetical protein